MRHVIRKPAFCVCENKGADQLPSNCAADQCLCFHYRDSTISILPKTKIFKPLAIFCGCTARFVSDLVGNPKDRFSRDWQADLHFCYSQMSRVVRKPALCICENKDADQLGGNHEADQRLCFCYTDSTIPLLPKCKISSL